MNHQVIGIILLIAAVATGIYVSTHYAQLTGFKFALPKSLRLVSVPPQLFLTPAPPSNSQAVTDRQKPVSISYISPASNYSPYAKMVLTSDGGSASVVDVTGWTVKSRTGQSFTIPKAQEVYSFGGEQGDITLKSGDAVNLYSIPGPKGNFRMNKCMGYMEDQTPFTPSIPMMCPTVPHSETVNFSSQCQDYAASLRACQNPSANPPLPYNDTACRDYLSKLNYVGCVARYGKDADFLSREWWVWMDAQMNIFDPVHDKVQLSDKAGKVVDEYTY